MNNAIYKKMIIESSIPYAKVELVIENEVGVLYFREVNKSFSELLTNKREDIIDKPILDFVPKSTMRELYRDFTKETDTKYVRHEYAVFKDTYYSVEVHTSDRCEFEMLFNRVSKTQNKLSNILKQSPFIAFIKDLESRYIDVNEAFLKTFNICYSDIIGKNHSVI